MASVSKSSLIVSGAASSGGVVPGNSFSIVSYTVTSYSGSTGSGIPIALPPIIRVYGPGETILASFTSATEIAGSAETATYSFAGGVALINS